MSNACVDSDQFTVDETGRLQLKLGCGLDSDANGVKAKVSTWPYDCPIGTGSTKVHCDPATGLLRGDPKFMARAIQDFTSVDPVVPPDAIAPGGSVCALAVIESQVDLTDYCENQFFSLDLQAKWDVVIRPDSSLEVTATQSIDGNPFTSIGVIRVISLGNTVDVTDADSRNYVTAQGTLAAGVPHILQYRVCIKNTGTENLFWNNVSSAARGVMMTAHLP